jgi:hypothetical protein
LFPAPESQLRGDAVGLPQMKAWFDVSGIRGDFEAMVDAMLDLRSFGKAT